MKKFLAILMAGTLAMSAGACGTADEEPDSAEETEESVEESRRGETPDAGNEVSTDKISFDVSSEDSGEDQGNPAGGAAEGSEAPDLSGAVEGIITTEVDPVPLGSWAEIGLYATQDSTYHTAYVRVIRVTTQSEDSAYVDSAIEVNNAYGNEEDRFDASEQDIPEDCELVVLDYEVYVPDNFPAANYGMTEPKIYFSLRNYGGGGFPSADGSDVYLGLGSAYELTVRELGSIYLPGNTYREKSIYVMVRGYTDYVASYSSYPDGTTSDETSAENMYTVYHSLR